MRKPTKQYGASRRWVPLWVLVVVLCACGRVDSHSFGAGGGEQEPQSAEVMGGRSSVGEVGDASVSSGVAAGWRVSAVAPGGTVKGVELGLRILNGVAHIAYAQGYKVFAHSWTSAGRFETTIIDERSPRDSVSWTIGAPSLDLVFAGRSYTQNMWTAAQTAEGWTEPADVSLPEGAVAGSPSAVWVAGERKLLYLQNTPINESSFLVDSTEGLKRHLPVFDGTPLDSTEFGTETSALVPPETALGIDSKGNSHFVYFAPVDRWTDHVAVAELAIPFTVRTITVSADGVWSAPVTLSQPAGYYEGLSLVVDSLDTVHISYLARAVAGGAGEAPVVAHNRIVYFLRRPETTGWEPQPVPSTTRPRMWRGSLALDGAGVAHLAFCEGRIEEIGGCTAVVHAVRESAGWRKDVVQEGCHPLGEQVAVAVEGSGAVHLVYGDCDRALVHATHE